MAMFRSISSVRTLAVFLSLLAVAGATVVLVAPDAEAVPAYGTHYKYYSDATHSYQVGYRYYDCNGVLKSQWGVTSPYYTRATYGCIIEN